MKATEEFYQKLDELIHASGEARAHASVMFEALGIFVERDKVRGDLWRQAGKEDSAHHLKSKAMRLTSGLGKRAEYEEDGILGYDQETLARIDETLIDEALDAINYAVFLVRNLRGD